MRDFLFWGVVLFVNTAVLFFVGVTYTIPQGTDFYNHIQWITGGVHYADYGNTGLHSILYWPGVFIGPAAAWIVAGGFLLTCFLYVVCALAGSRNGVVVFVGTSMSFSMSFFFAYFPQLAAMTAAFAGVYVITKKQPSPVWVAALAGTFLCSFFHATGPPLWVLCAATVSLRTSWSRIVWPLSIVALLSTAVQWGHFYNVVTLTEPASRSFLYGSINMMVFPLLVFSGRRNVRLLALFAAVLFGSIYFSYGVRFLPLLSGIAAAAVAPNMKSGVAGGSVLWRVALLTFIVFGAVNAYSLAAGNVWSFYGAQPAMMASNVASFLCFAWCLFRSRGRGGRADGHR